MLVVLHESIIDISHQLTANFINRLSTHFINHTLLILTFYSFPKLPLSSFYLHLLCSFSILIISQFLFRLSLIISSMKLKFLTKEERETIKARRQKEQNMITQKLNHYPINSNGVKHTQINGLNIKETNNIKIFKQTQSNLHKNHQNNQRQRSRDKKQIIEQEQKQLEENKKKYMGLTKQIQSNRQSQSYKKKLHFAWENSEDTSLALNNNIAKFIPSKADPFEIETTRNWRQKTYQEMNERDWRIFREDNEIYVKGGKVPNPFRQWHQLAGLHPTILKNLKRLKFDKPRPVQMQAITIGMVQKDLMAVAPTGEGKTLAYLVPMIQFVLPLERVTALNAEYGPYGIVLVPSRELAEQIDNQLTKVSEGLGITTLNMVGGRQLQLQTIALERGCDLLIGTPGRVKELIEKHYLSLSRCSWVVIDEADKMISQNLMQDLAAILDLAGSQSIVAQRKEGRKNIVHMFSATMIPEIQKLGKSYLSFGSSYITIGQPGGGKKEIDQRVELLDQQSKPEVLGRILKGIEGPIIIFVNQRERCGKLVKLIQQRWNRLVCDYHGGKNQQQREKVIDGFRKGKFQILVATDLAGRGLDVKGINAVVSYDAPKNISEFIHRSGRTGRAGMKGRAFTLLTAANEDIFYDVKVFLQKNGFKVPQNLSNHPAANTRPGCTVKVPRNKQIVYTN